MPQSFKTLAVGRALSKLRVVRWDDGIRDLGSREVPFTRIWIEGRLLSISVPLLTLDLNDFRVSQGIE